VLTIDNLFKQSFGIRPSQVHAGMAQSQASRHGEEEEEKKTDTLRNGTAGKWRFSSI
jgi:hypothetical protein